MVSHVLTINTILILGDVRAPQGDYPATTMQAPVHPQNLNRYSYVTNNPLKYTDPVGQWTVMITLEAAFGYLMGGTGTMGFICDGEGNWAILSSTSVTIGNTGIAVSGGFQMTNADNIWQVLDGKQVKFSVGGDYGIGGSVGYVTDMDLSLYQGGQVNVGLGFETKASVSVNFNSDIIFSSDMINDVGYIDGLLFYMYTTGQISIDLYASFYYYYYSGGDPLILFFYIMMQADSNADQGSEK